MIIRTWFVLPPLKIAKLGCKVLLRGSPRKSSWIVEHKNIQKDLDEKLATSQRPFPQLFFYKHINEQQKANSSLNATKIQNKRPTKIQIKSLNRASTHNFKGIVKRAETCKCEFFLVSRTVLHKRITASLKQMAIFIFDVHRWLAAIISPYKFTQRHSSEGCLFSSEKTCDVSVRSQ